MKTAVKETFQRCIGTMKIISFFLDNDENVKSLFESVLLFSKKLSAHSLLIISNSRTPNIPPDGYSKPHAIQFILKKNQRILF